MTLMQRGLPWLMLVLGALLVVALARPVRDPGGEYNLSALGRAAVSADGRVKPLDSVARSTLRVLSGRETLVLEKAGPDGRLVRERLPAIRWLADVIARPQVADDYPVFRVDHDGVRSILGVMDEQKKRLSFHEIWPHAMEIDRQSQAAQQVPAKDRSAFQRQLLELHADLIRYRSLQVLASPYMIPPRSAEETWQPLEQAGRAAAAGDSHPALGHIERIFVAYNQQQAGAFNGATAEYLTYLRGLLPHETRKAEVEVFFNNFRPFLQGTALYLLAFVLAGLGLLLSNLARPGWSRALWRGALGLTVMGFLIHTVGLGLRIYLMGRPPVTNLYASAVFIGWGCVLFALVLEVYFRRGLGLLASTFIGFVTLVIALNLAADQVDNMGVMQAVLDTNFWLATHVPTVTLGYAATFLAGLLGAAYILLGVFSRALADRDTVKAFGKMVYGVVCFALLLSFVGTVLGGIWADQSWGRFWGWDPKENGAVLIVLMTALILHARWGGMIRERGMMVLAVGGNIVTAWSWFGTNMLGVGLHSYGFMNSAMFWMWTFVFSQVMVMVIGLLPLRAWKSFEQPLPAVAAAPAAAAAPPAARPKVPAPARSI